MSAAAACGRATKPPEAGATPEPSDARVRALADAYLDGYFVRNPDQVTLFGVTGLYPTWLRDLGEAGYGRIESFSFDLPVAYTHEEWRGRTRAGASRVRTWRYRTGSSP